MCTKKNILCPYVYWDWNVLISALQRQILVHCFLYYEDNKSIIKDTEYDKMAKELFKLQSEYKKNKIILMTDYGYVFYDFDSATGFDLYANLNEQDKAKIKRIANLVYFEYKAGRK